MIARASSGGIVAEGLVKHYGEVKALDGLDLEVPEGAVLGLLGPNGAGKTTSVRVLTTLLEPDAGHATVAGLDVIRQAAELRRIIGLSGQYAAVDEQLTGRENLDMVGRLDHLGKRRSSERAVELLERFDLTEAADRVVKTYSGGMRRRLDLAGALVAEPPVLFLDEPTTGLDPRSRQQMWHVIEELVRGGTTVLLTTQYLEEADLLADSIAVVDRGRVIARGTADELKSQVGGEWLEMIATSQADVAVVTAVAAAVGSGEPAYDAQARRVSVPIAGGTKALMEALRRLDAEGVTLTDVAIRRPTLDDVFLTLTGHAAEDESDQRGEPAKAGAGRGRRSGRGGRS